MKFSIDFKSLIIGFLLAAVVFLTLGQTSSSADEADFGIAVTGRNRGMAVVRSVDGTLYSVDPDSAKANIIEYDDGPFRGNAFNLNRRLVQD
jgi:hypothetical protein